MKKVAERLLWTSAALFLAAGPAMADNSIAVTNAAAMNGTNFGLEVLMDGTGSPDEAYVQSLDPSDDGRFSLSFFVDPNALQMNLNSRFFVVRAWQTGPGQYQEMMRVALNWIISNGVLPNRFVLTTFVYRHGSVTKVPGMLNMGNVLLTQPSKIELQYTRATDPDSEDGTFRILRNGIEIKNNTSVDNPYDLDFFRMGLTSRAGFSQGNGSFYLDEVVVTRLP